MPWSKTTGGEGVGGATRQETKRQVGLRERAELGEKGGWALCRQSAGFLPKAPERLRPPVVGELWGRL